MLVEKQTYVTLCYLLSIVTQFRLFCCPFNADSFEPLLAWKTLKQIYTVLKFNATENDGKIAYHWLTVRGLNY